MRTCLTFVGSGQCGLRGLGGDSLLGNGVAEEVGGCPKELSFAALQEDLSRVLPDSAATQRGRGWHALRSQSKYQRRGEGRGGCNEICIDL
eukprot:311472-Hanusia_phi.AAC.1